MNLSDQTTSRPAPAVILLVDDDPDCRLLLRDAISQARMCSEVFEVANGAEAIEFLHARGAFAGKPPPELIYLDLEMPKMDGHETLRRIRQISEFRDIPVVIMSGVSDEAQMRRAAEQGANSYTIKPSDPEQFSRTVLEATDYWLTVHQRPARHLPSEACRR